MCNELLFHKLYLLRLNIFFRMKNLSNPLNNGLKNKILFRTFHFIGIYVFMM